MLSGFTCRRNTLWGQILLPHQRRAGFPPEWRGDCKDSRNGHGTQFSCAAFARQQYIRPPGGTGDSPGSSSHRRSNPCRKVYSRDGSAFGFQYNRNLRKCASEERDRRDPGGGEYSGNKDRDPAFSASLPVRKLTSQAELIMLSAELLRVLDLLRPGFRCHISIGRIQQECIRSDTGLEAAFH